MKYVYMVIFYAVLFLLTLLANRYFFNNQIENTLGFFQAVFSALMIYSLRLSLISYYKSQQSAVNILHYKKEYQRKSFENLICKRPYLLICTLIPFMENRFKKYWAKNQIADKEWKDIDDRSELETQDITPFVFQAIVSTKFCMIMATNSLLYLIIGITHKIF